MNTFLYTIILIAAFLSAKFHITHGKSISEANRHRIPKITLFLSAILGFSFIMQLIFPQLLSLFQRNTTLVISGELWRLVTALFFQDGGIAGALSNIFYLLLIGSVAEMQWDKRQFLLIFFVGGIVSECIALLLQPIGAGNSVANFALAGSLLFITLKNGTPITRVISSIGIIGTLWLLCMKDIHGSAVIIGMLLGWTALMKTKLEKK